MMPAELATRVSPIPNDGRPALRDQDGNKPPGQRTHGPGEAEDGWQWLVDWQRWGHAASGMMFDPLRSAYFLWDGAEMHEIDATETVADNLVPRQDLDGESLSEGEEAELEADLDGESLSGSDLQSIDGESLSEGDIAARRCEEEGEVEDGELVGEGEPVDMHEAGSSHRRDLGDSGQGGASDVCGDWIWDGEWWVTATGYSYHPVLRQLFLNGKRVLSKEEAAPWQDVTAAREKWEQDRYALDYGAFANAPQGDVGEQSEEAHKELPEPDQEASSTKGRPPRTHTVGPAGATIGRSTGCDIRVRCPLMSREHCRIVWEPEAGRFALVDCGGRRGTLLNGKRVAAHSGEGGVVFHTEDFP